MDNHQIGKFITELRKEKGLTQQQLGERLYVTDKAVSKWERGLSLPDITLLEKLAQELDVDVSEILQGKRGKKKNINVEEEIEKVVQKMEEEQRLRKKRLKKICFSIFFLLIILLLVSFLFIHFYDRKYHPSIIREGDNTYEFGFLGNYSLEKEGLDEFQEVVEKTETLDYDKINISYMDIEVDQRGNLLKFNIHVQYFDENLTWLGDGYYLYEEQNLHYQYETAKENTSVLVMTYAKSSTVEYISEKLKMIPLKKQIHLSDLNYYHLLFQNNRSLEEGMPVFDGRESKKIEALSFSDYQNGLGGTVREGIYFAIILNDGSGYTTDEDYYYVFDTIEGDIKNLGYLMETDYYINNGTLSFTRDYGQSRILSDATKKDIEETLNFYRSNALLTHSWTISTNELIPIAYFYGEEPKLKISNDNGSSWTFKEFVLDEDYYKPVTRRIVRFVDQNFGYVALGTDWSMGSGEIKKAFFTHDGGSTWEEVQLPLNYSSNTLMDFYMYNEQIGMVALYHSESAEFPLLYYTINGGEDWELVSYDYSFIPREVVYLSTIEDIEYREDRYYITMGQGDSDHHRVIFEATTFDTMTYLEHTTAQIHTVG